MLPVNHQKLTQAEVDFAAPASFDPLVPPEAALCCLGTTIARAGSKEAFRKVDFDAVVTFAKAAREKGAKTFIHVTALGANTRSSIFYNAVKGEVEDAVAALGFASTVALRPSFLDGERSEKRPMERAGILVGRALGPLLGKYRPTPVAAVAKAMIDKLKNPPSGRYDMEANEIFALSR